MKVEQIGDATLYLGDCLEILPTLPKVDAVVTDPPYGINYQGGANSKNSISTVGKRFSVKIVGDNKPFDPNPWLSLAACCFTGAHHFASRLPGGSFHVWNKRGPYKPLDQADGDLIWVSGKKTPLRIIDLVWRGLCRTTENTEPILHPTQKPVALMNWCIEQTEAQTILDPFMGSGTTGVACAQLGRKFIGIEIEPKYYEIALRRIEDAYRQKPLFPEPKRDVYEQVDMLYEQSGQR